MGTAEKPPKLRWKFKSFGEFGEFHQQKLIVEIDPDKRKQQFKN